MEKYKPKEKKRIKKFIEEAKRKGIKEEKLHFTDGTGAVVFGNTIVSTFKNSPKTPKPKKSRT